MKTVSSTVANRKNAHCPTKNEYSNLMKFSTIIQDGHVMKFENRISIGYSQSHKNMLNRWLYRPYSQSDQINVSGKGGSIKRISKFEILKSTYVLKLSKPCVMHILKTIEKRKYRILKQT